MLFFVDLSDGSALSGVLGSFGHFRLMAFFVDVAVGSALAGVLDCLLTGAVGLVLALLSGFRFSACRLDAAVGHARVSDERALALGGALAPVPPLCGTRCL